MKKTVWLLCIFAALGKAQTDKPKLVVGIVVDQMRNDFLYRYWDRYGQGGFKRLIGKGFQFRNAHYNYIPTYTGPGHASIYTGATPRAHGIIANDWYIKSNNGWTYCVQDDNVQPVGTESKAGKASPMNLLSSTISDELKMSSNGRSKVYAVAMKDRSAVLPAGHAADAAFWLDDKEGKFISSSWYLKSLPAWAQDFNSKKYAENYLKSEWTSLYPINTYTNSIADDNSYEIAPFGPRPVFPHKFDKYTSAQNYSIVKGTPFGCTLTKDFAIECLKKENLGKDEFTDMLCISFSSPDHIAHTFGPRSIEVEDTYLRLDKDIETLLNTLDQEVGAGNYLVFLTADHGGADVPNHLKDNKIPAGYLRDQDLKKTVQEFLKNNYGDTAILANLNNGQIFLNEKKVFDNKASVEEVEQRLCRFLLNVPGIAEAFTSQVMKNEGFGNEDYRTLLQNGYNHKRSGNVCFMLEPAWMDNEQKGTTHGAGYNYDTHVPLVFYGKGIKHGQAYDKVSITQIAPTISECLDLNQPNSCTSEPLNKFFK